MSAEPSEELRNAPIHEGPVPERPVPERPVREGPVLEGPVLDAVSPSGSEPRAERLSAELWVALLPRLRRVARSLGVAAADIEDVIQDVSMAALEKCPADWHEGQVTGWLYRVTINRCYLRHRQTRQHALRQSKLQQDLWASNPFGSGVEPFPSGETAALQAEARELVQRQLQLLPAVQHEVLVLKYYAGLNAQQIAELLEIPSGTVRTRLRQARLRLAEALEKLGFEHD